MKEGWEIKKLKDICDKASSNIAQNKIKEITGDYPVYGASGYIQNIDTYKYDRPYIGIIKDGSGVGRVNIYPAYTSLLGTLQYIIPKEGYLLSFVSYVLKNINLSSFASGAAIPHIYFRDYGETLVKVPNLTVQTRIVEELDLLNGILDKKRQQLKELDALSQSIFYDMFGDPISNEKNWQIQSLKDTVHNNCPISYGIVQPMDDVENGIPIVRPVDLTETYITKQGLKRTAKEISDSYKRTQLRGDEILICVRGTTGVVSLATEELKGCNTTRGIVPLYFDERINKIYMFTLFQTTSMRNLIQSKSYGIALKQINIKDLRLLSIPVPPITLQNEFADKIKSIERQKQLIKASIAETQTLLDSRMDYYFN